jgi:hypothetical protein
MCELSWMGMWRLRVSNEEPYERCHGLVIGNEIKTITNHCLSPHHNSKPLFNLCLIQVAKL